MFIAKSASARRLTVACHAARSLVISSTGSLNPYARTRILVHFPEPPTLHRRSRKASQQRHGPARELLQPRPLPATTDRALQPHRMSLIFRNNGQVAGYVMAVDERDDADVGVGSDSTSGIDVASETENGIQL